MAGGFRVLGRIFLESLHCGKSNETLNTLRSTVRPLTGGRMIAPDRMLSSYVALLQSVLDTQYSARKHLTLGLSKPYDIRH